MKLPIGSSAIISIEGKLEIGTVLKAWRRKEDYFHDVKTENGSKLAAIRYDSGLIFIDKSKTFQFNKYEIRGSDKETASKSRKDTGS